LTNLYTGPVPSTFPAFVRLTCLGSEHVLYALGIAETVDTFDGTIVGLVHRAEAMLKSHEVHEEEYSYSWLVLDHPRIVRWARDMYGPNFAEAIVVSTTTARRTTSDERANAEESIPPAAWPLTSMRLPTTTNEGLDELVDELARRLYVAVVSVQAQVTYRTAERNYGQSPPPRSSHWHTLARIAMTFFHDR
jgi:hypothetical protein